MGVWAELLRYPFSRHVIPTRALPRSAAEPPRPSRSSVGDPMLGGPSSHVMPTEGRASMAASLSGLTRDLLSSRCGHKKADPTEVGSAMSGWLVFKSRLFLDNNHILFFQCFH